MGKGRISRRNREDIEYLDGGDITVAFDNAFKSAWRINDDEFDFISENSTDDELNAITFDLNGKSFSQKRESIIAINNLMEKYYVSEIH